MPMHDWKRVVAGIFHDFHQSWIIAIRDALNGGVLPQDFYALVEQSAEGPIPDVLTLERLAESDDPPIRSSPISEGGLAVADHPPQVSFTLEAELDIYADRASRVAVYHAAGDRVVAFIEIVSPGNKHSEISLRKLLEEMTEAMKYGVHLLIVDPHRPTPRDPQGIHHKFWTENFGQSESPGVTVEKPLGMSAYRSDVVPNAYFEPFAVGQILRNMPLFLTPDRYINIPLEKTYQDAWKGVPLRWKRVIEPPAGATEANGSHEPT